MNILNAAPFIAALALAPGCKKEQTATLPVPKTGDECSLEAGSRLASQTLHTHEQGAVYRYHPDGFGPAIEQVERAKGIDVYWVKHPEKEGDPSGIVVKVRGKVAYTLMPTETPQCGIATPTQEGARSIECPPHSDRTREQREAANAAYYKCLGKDIYGNPTK